MSSSKMSVGMLESVGQGYGEIPEVNEKELNQRAIYSSLRIANLF